MIKTASRFSFLARLRFAAAAAIAMAATGCGSAPADTDGPGPRDTGTYPNLNILPKKAAPQFTSAEHAAAVKSLTAKRVATQAPQPNPPGDESRQLTDLGRTHGKRTLDEIEKAK